MLLNLHLHNPETTAIIDSSGQSITYKNLIDSASEFSNFIGENSLVFILSENSIGSAIGFYSCLGARAVPLLLSKTLDSDLLKNLVKIYRPTHFYAPATMEIPVESELVFSSYNYSLRATFERPLQKHPDLAFLLPTSGSTGSPKLVRHSYNNLESSASAVAALFNLKNSDKPVAILPMHYTMGLSVISSHLYAGSTVLLSSANLMDKSFWDFTKNNRATSFTGVPFSYEILKKIRFTRMNLPDLELITQGGGKMPEALFREFSEFANTTGRRFIATYGQTEGTARMAYLPPELALRKTCSIGNAIPGGKLWLIDSRGNKIDRPGVEGEMIYSGPNVTMGYAQSREDLHKGDERNGILHTGDIAWRDSDDCYYITGRLQRFLKIYGLRISLDEVESIIATELGIQSSAAGTDDRLTVYLTDGNYKDMTAELIASKTGLFHKSIHIVIIDEFKRNEAGKIIYKP